MKEELIKFQTAELAKEKGFDWVCEKFYHRDGFLDKDWMGKNWNKTISGISAPNQSILQRWLREVHLLHISLDSSPKGYGVWIYKLNKPLQYGNEHEAFPAGNRRFLSYENALEKGLQKALEMI